MSEQEKSKKDVSEEAETPTSEESQNSDIESSKDSDLQEESENEKTPYNRRDFITTATTIGMAGGLVFSYGTFAGMAGKFLYPSKPTEKRWLFVSSTNLEEFKRGDSLTFKKTIGEKVAIARQGENGRESDFIAI